MEVKKTYQNCFKRIEEKYMFTKEKYLELMARISEHLEPTEYPSSSILNLYFDSDNFDLAIRSIQKPTYKEKIRLRCYNTPNDDSELFLEIKNKYKGVTGKRRIVLTREQYERYIKTGRIKELEDNQIFNEIDYIIKRNHIYPRVMVAYDRKAYYLKEDHNIRITFDCNLRSRNECLDLFLGDSGKKFFDEDVYILEIKSLDVIPIWFAKILNELKIYPTSFSKYGEIYKKTVLNCKAANTYTIIRKDEIKLPNIDTQNNVKKYNMGIRIA